MDVLEQGDTCFSLKSIVMQEHTLSLMSQIWGRGGLIATFFSKTLSESMGRAMHCKLGLGLLNSDPHLPTCSTLIVKFFLQSAREKGARPLG